MWASHMQRRLPDLVRRGTHRRLASEIHLEAQEEQVQEGAEAAGGVEPEAVLGLQPPISAC